MKYRPAASFANRKGQTGCRPIELAALLGALGTRTPGSRLERKCDEALPTGLGPGMPWPSSKVIGSILHILNLDSTRLGNHRAASPEGAQAFAAVVSLGYLHSRSDDSLTARAA